MKSMKSVTSPQRALDELKSAIKDGRDLIGRGDWTELKSTVNFIKKLLLYLDNWSKVIPFDKLPYDSKFTEDLLWVINTHIFRQLDYEYPTKNCFGFPLAFGGDAKKIQSLGDSWDLLEIALEMNTEYSKQEMLEQEGVADEWSGMEGNDDDIPSDILGEEDDDK